MNRYLVRSNEKLNNCSNNCVLFIWYKDTLNFTKQSFNLFLSNSLEWIDCNCMFFIDNACEYMKKSKEVSGYNYSTNRERVANVENDINRQQCAYK